MLETELRELEQALMLYPAKADDQRYQKLTERAVLLRKTLKKLKDS